MFSLNPFSIKFLQALIPDVFINKSPKITTIWFKKYAPFFAITNKMINVFSLIYALVACWTGTRKDEGELQEVKRTGSRV